ncbi:class F sortase [Phycicoccus sp. DTK01]|uniref:class F sortase n=1 Tax=Phycicoccus sp. DTK01 TaxID=2785745 RepID=UPI001AA83AA8|nr:class F sortase [Phycicoccus sp. DTK01]GIL35192.1 class F sortase [Phycicoccus sp. DTK01]
MTPAATRLLTAGAAVAAAGGLAVAAVAATRDEPARLAGPVVAGSVPAVSPSPTARATVAGPGGFAQLAPEAWPTPDVPDSVAVTRRGPNDASLPARATGGSAAPGDRPARVRIPAIGVDSRLVDLGIAPDGTMEVPRDPALAGWLTAAAAPGQRGPAVIAGHVDTHTGPAVFVRLRELRPGDEVEVVQRDGDVVRFTVRSSVQVAKDDFPTEAVYGPQPGPVLRLVTCSGEIDPVTGHYTDNTVVFAS